MKIHFRRTYRDVRSVLIGASGEGNITFPPIPMGHCAYLEYVNVDTNGATAPVVRGSLGGAPEITLADVGPRPLAPEGLMINAGEVLRFDVDAADTETISVACQWRLYEVEKATKARVTSIKTPIEQGTDSALDERSPADPEPQPKEGLPRPDSDSGIFPKGS